MCLSGNLESGLVACVMPYCARPLVSRDTALHKQLEVTQAAGSTHCSGIPYGFHFNINDNIFHNTR